MACLSQKAAEEALSKVTIANVPGHAITDHQQLGAGGDCHLLRSVVGGGASMSTFDLP